MLVDYVVLWTMAAGAYYSELRSCALQYCVLLCSCSSMLPNYHPQTYNNQKLIVISLRIIRDMDVSVCHLLRLKISWLMYWPMFWVVFGFLLLLACYQAGNMGYLFPSSRGMWENTYLEYVGFYSNYIHVWGSFVFELYSYTIRYTISSIAIPQFEKCETYSLIQFFNFLLPYSKP